MKIRSLLVAGFALSLSAPLAAQTLSLEEALRIAEAQSPRLAAQRHSIEAAAELVGRAAELPDPKLRLGLENLPVTGSERFRYDRDFMTARSVGVMQDFPSEAKRRARGARAEAMRVVEQAGLEAQRAAVHREAAAAWLDVHFAEKALGALERLAGQFQLQIDAVAVGVSRGRQSGVEAYTLRQALEQVNDRVIEQAKAVRKARIRLAGWLPADASRPLGPPPDTARFAHPREHLVTRLAEHPMLRVYDDQATLAEREVDLARSSKSSDWSLQVGYAQREPAFSNMVSVAVTIDLPWQAERRQDRDIAAKLSEAGRVRALREESRRTHEAELRAWIADLDTASERIGRFSRVLLPLAHERVAAARAAYQGGRGELGPVLEAERSVAETEAAMIAVEAERARAWADLNFVYSQGGRP
ncbi:MAG: TolC family protein [Betaproteobacteria bacterium]